MHANAENPYITTICRHHSSFTFLLALTVGGCAMMLSPYIEAAIASDLQLGAAAVKITPPLGTPMAGYYGERKSQGVLDNIYAKAVVLDDGKTPENAAPPFRSPLPASVRKMMGR
jgi:hypothetical protein